MQELFDQIYNELKFELKIFRESEDREVKVRSFANMLSGIGQLRLIVILNPDLYSEEIVGAEKLNNADALVRTQLIPWMAKK